MKRKLTKAQKPYWGDLTGIRGDLSSIRGDLDDCGITDEERARGVNVEDLIEIENEEQK